MNRLPSPKSSIDSHLGLEAAFHVRKPVSTRECAVASTPRQRNNSLGSIKCFRVSADVIASAIAFGWAARARVVAQEAQYEYNRTKFFGASSLNTATARLEPRGLGAGAWGQLHDCQPMGKGAQ